MLNYKKIYDEIIERAQNEELENKRKKGNGTYYEYHHILPRCLGGDDNKENLALLTGREHFICHELLPLIYTLPAIRKKLIYALFRMSNNNQLKNHMIRGYDITSRTYEKIRLEYLPIQTADVRARCEDPLYRKAMSDKAKKKFDDPKHRERMQQLSIIAANCENSKIAHNTPEYKSKMSELTKKRWQDPLFREKMNKIRSSEEYKSKYEQGVQNRDYSYMNADYKNQISTRMKQKWQDPEYILKFEQIRADPEYGKKISNGIIESYKQKNKK